MKQIFALIVLLSVLCSVLGRRWKTALWLDVKGKKLTTDIGELAFNQAFSKCPVVRGQRTVYVRTTSVPKDFNAYNIFAKTWADSPNNTLNKDFKLFDNIKDARTKKGAWTWCDYNYKGANGVGAGAGFPANCGKTGKDGGFKFFALPEYYRFSYIQKRKEADQGLEIYVGRNCPSPEGWLTALWLNVTGKKLTTDIGKDAFNKAFKKCPVVRGQRTVYVRTTPLPRKFDAYNIFANTWADKPKNTLNKDFKLFDNIKDARTKKGAWTWCDYNYKGTNGGAGAGFPANCGKSGKDGSFKFFALPEYYRFSHIQKRKEADQGLEIYVGRNCPSPVGYYTKCVRDYKKMGCYEEDHTAMDLIISDRDFKGKELNWNYFNESIHSLACRCSAEAKRLKYTYFSIRYWAECWAGKDQAKFVEVLTDKKKYERRDDKCLSYQFAQCKDDHSQECVGTANHEYFYSIPINGGYSPWNTWSSCDVKCGGGSKRRTRTCTKPKPMRFGKGCQKLGASNESTSCNAQACPLVNHMDVTTCERTSKKISCPSGKGINIIDADYGREDDHTCKKGSIKTTNCHSKDALRIVRHQCHKRASCVLEAKNAIFKDPCIGTFKYLDVRYNCVKVNHVDVTICERTKKRTISCPSGKGINIIAADYGRYSSHTCKRGSIKTLRCHSKNALSIVRRKCHKRNSCVLEAKNAVFKDPCIGTYKYLDVRYKCVADTCKYEGRTLKRGNKFISKKCMRCTCHGYNHVGCVGLCPTFNVRCKRTQRAISYRKKVSNKPTCTCNRRKCVGRAQLKLQKARMRSPYSRYPANYAIDGKTSNGKVVHGRCANSLGKGSIQWWKGELSSVSIIDSIKVYSRQDCCKSRYVDVKIWVGGAGGWKLCHKFGNSLQYAKGWTEVLCPTNTRGKYIKMTQGNSEEFSLCEIEVYGYSLQAIAKLKLRKAVMRSPYKRYPASYAIDGRTSNGKVTYGRCANSHKGGSIQWWRGTLSSTATIHSIRIYSRQDCCKYRYTNVKVWTREARRKWTLCKDLGNSLQKAKGWTEVKCAANTRGRYIKVTQGNSQEFSLCEIEVYGSPIIPGLYAPVA